VSVRNPDNPDTPDKVDRWKCPRGAGFVSVRALQSASAPPTKRGEEVTMNDLNPAAPESGTRRRKAVFTIVDGPTPERKFFVRIGVGFENRDQSLNIKLDATPVNGTLHIRDDDREAWKNRRDEQGRQGSLGVKGGA
jgi:hypothetical protein